jgi:hypothetical protein
VNTPPTPVPETREPCDGWGHGNRLAHSGVLTCASRVPQTLGILLANPAREDMVILLVRQSTGQSKIVFSLHVVR